MKSIFLQITWIKRDSLIIGIIIKENIPSSGKEQSRRGQQGSIHSSKSWTGHKNWNNPRHAAVKAVGKGYGDGLRAQDLSGREGGVEGNNGEDIDDKADNTWDCNGTRQIAHGILDLYWLLWQLVKKRKSLLAVKWHRILLKYT